MSNIQKWAVMGQAWFLRDATIDNNKLENTIYHLAITPKEELYLVKGEDHFDFPYKIYGKETKFIDRVLKTYHNTKGNLGILLNGIKGTGKTVTSKLIANGLEMPVIVVGMNAGGALNSFLNSIHQDIVVFIDEYEKLYADDDGRDRGAILTIMDGVLDNGFRKVFLLTTNQMYINDNLIQRPGRIRYLKVFGDLELETIIEIVDDKLKHAHLRDQTIKFISTLEVITIDIVKSVIEEVNIHEEDPEAFKDCFNIKVLNKKYNIIEIHKDKFDKEGKPLEEIIASCVTINPVKLTKKSINNYFRYDDNSENLGIVKKVNDDLKSFEVDEYVDEDDKGNDIYVRRTFRLEDADSFHSSFKNYHLAY